MKEAIDNEPVIKIKGGARISTFVVTRCWLSARSVSKALFLQLPRI